MVSARNPCPIAGRYQLGEWIGQGGMGTVFRGVDLETGERVAIKQLRADVTARDPSSAERFRREGEALQRLAHPNIVRVLAIVHEDASDFLVMEYVGGGSLEQLLLATDEPLPIERVLRIGLDLCDALIRTHRLDIVHRDLKPSNVLLADDGTPRLSDFGAAHVKGETRLTRASAIIGTADYLSPESLRGENADPRVDIWALGVLLFEMLTRKRPFGHDSIAQTLHSIIFSSPPDLRALRPDCPPALVHLVYRMLVKNPSQRVPSARQVSVELDDILHGRAPSVFVMPASSPEPGREGLLLRNNLSCDAATFVGRQPEIAELERLLGDSATRLITILAPGGMGKTRLATELGHRLITAALVRDAGSEVRFEHGVFMVQLAPLGSADFIVSAIAEAIGLQLYAGREPKQQLFDYFREKRLLLLLDNFEHLLDGAPIASELLQTCPGLVIVATSRERLGLTAETVFPLSGMELPEVGARESAVHAGAVMLFVQGARQQRPDFRLKPEDVDAVSSICRLVQGVPLGIVLAASWAGTLSLPEIADEISRGLDFLTAELRDLPERQRSMRAVFDHSWKLLTEHEQSVLAGLSVFRGGFTREAARTVAEANVQVLTSLINKSLLRRDRSSGRYEAHELLRQYAEEKLRGRHASFLERHARYFARYLQSREQALKGPSPRQALADIDAELDNVRAAWAHLLTLRELEEIARCLEPLNVFHTLRASFAEGESVFRALVAAFRTETHHTDAERGRVFWRALSFQAMFLRQQGRYAHAQELLEEALGALDEHTHPRELAFALVAAGSTMTKTGDLERGRLFAERGLALYRATDDGWGLSNTLETLGRIYGTSGDFRAAEQAFRESAIVQRDFGLMQSGLMGLGVATVQQGQYAKGCSMLLDALSMFEEAGDVWNKMRCQMNLANAQRNLGNYGSAESLAKSCLAFWQEVGNWDHEAWCYFQLGNIFKEQGAHERAREMFTRAHARSIQTGDAGKIALAKLEFGWLALLGDERAESRKFLLESLSGFESSGQTWGVALALDALGYLACQERDFPSARLRFERALMVSMELELYPFATNVIAGIALLSAREGEPERAVELAALVRSHGATERHTLTRRVLPLLSELRSALSSETFEAAFERGRALDLERFAESLACELRSGAA